jgi:hypothetical protein
VSERGLGPRHDVGCERLTCRRSPPQPDADGLVVTGAQRAVDDGCSREVVTPNRWSTCQVNVGENPALLTITTKVAAAEFAAHRITVNAVGPGQHGHRAVRAADGAATRGSWIRGVEVWRYARTWRRPGGRGEAARADNL